MKKPLKNTDAFLALVAIGVAAIVGITSCTATAGSSAQEVVLAGVHLEIVSTTLDTSFPTGCTGEAPACIQAQAGDKILSVTFRPRDLPEGQMLAYKNLPAVSVTLEDSTTVPYSLYRYDNVAHTLILGFQVPRDGSIAGLKWADSKEIPLQVTP